MIVASLTKHGMTKEEAGVLADQAISQNQQQQRTYGVLQIAGGAIGCLVGMAGFANGGHPRVTLGVAIASFVLAFYGVVRLTSGAAPE